MKKYVMLVTGMLVFQSYAMDSVQKLQLLLDQRDPSRILVAAGVGVLLGAAAWAAKIVHQKKWSQEAETNARALAERRVEDSLPAGAPSTALSPVAREAEKVGEGAAAGADLLAGGPLVDPQSTGAENAGGTATALLQPRQPDAQTRVIRSGWTRSLRLRQPKR